jgi:cyclomaltodextrinase / maltogenic alpha-amylase / neopullulanase
VLLQFTFPGAPMILYGDEIGLPGGIDPDNRRSFPWDSSRWDHDLRAFYQKCITLRRSHPALCTGDFKILFARGDILAYLRQNEQESLVVIFNRGETPYHANIDLSQHLPASVRLTDLLSPGETQLADGHLRDYNIQPLSGVVLAANTID